MKYAYAEMFIGWLPDAYERAGEYRVDPRDKSVLEAPEVLVGCQVVGAPW